MILLSGGTGVVGSALLPLLLDAGHEVRCLVRDPRRLGHDRVRVQLAGSPPIVAEVTPAAAVDLHLRDGGPVWVSVKATEIDVYPA